MKARTLLLPILFVTACSSAPVAPTKALPKAGGAPADFFPLAVGNEWVWDDVSPQLSAPRQAARTVRIVGRSADGFFQDSERTELRADGDCVRDRLRRLLCGPLAVGTAWRSVVSVSSTERYEIVGVGERVEVPAGRYEGCVRVRAHNRAGGSTEHVMEMTYAPGVGPVRLETWALVKGVAAPQIRAVLRSFRGANP
ncbi:MAG TPA: hypothetical protein VLT47_03915 [Anaeromyxobacteraceae bacterium]|nr:hypothetical protein [Anaeromyxobacteraceae bacterium]